MADNPSRKTLIRCHVQHRTGHATCAGFMLNENDPIYLPRFASIYSNCLPAEYMARAVDAVAEHRQPGTLFQMFVTMADDAQQYCAAQVAEHLLRMGGPYYIGKFAYYCEKIASLHSPKLDCLLANNQPLTSARTWMMNLQRSNQEKLRAIHDKLAAEGKPFKSPFTNIIEGREGQTPQFIVLHSSGPATPTSGIAFHCMNDVVPKPISAHFVVTRDGKVYQFVDLKDAARTNATSADPNDDNYYKFARHEFFKNNPVNANNFCVTIECAEFGRHGAVRIDSPQYVAILKTLALIHQETGIPIDDYHVIGHGDIAPLSKWFCPGPEFPIKSSIEDFREIGSRLPAAKPLSPEQLIKE